MICRWCFVKNGAFEKESLLFVLAFIFGKNRWRQSDLYHVEIRRSLSVSTLISLGFPYTVKLTS
jgi:hypothetical protein